MYLLLNYVLLLFRAKDDNSNVKGVHSIYGIGYIRRSIVFTQVWKCYRATMVGKKPRIV